MQNSRSIILQDSIKVPQKQRRRKRKAMPHTTNWYIQLLTLTVAAACLWLATACTENSDAPIYEGDVPVYKRIMPLDPCPNDINEYPSGENQPALSDGARLPYAQKVMEEHLIPILDKEGGPIWQMVTPYRIRDWPSIAVFDEWEGVVIIEGVFYSDDVQLSQLPPENRIPHCIEGVPVHFITNQPWAEATIRDYEEPDTQN